MTGAVASHLRSTDVTAEGETDRGSLHFYFCRGWQYLGPWGRRLCLLLLGALAALSFAPLFLLPGLVVGLIGLVWVTEMSPRRWSAFAAGWWWGLGHFLVSSYWIANSFLIDPARFGWMMPPAIGGLSAYLALFPALAASLAWQRRSEPWSHVFLFAAAWCFAEWLRGWLFTGFPWNLVAYAWAFSDPMMQSASIWGSWGLGLVTVLGIGLASIGLRGRPRRTGRALAGTAIIFAGLYGYGLARLSDAPDPMAALDQGAISLRLVQGNIDQLEKLSGANRDQQVMKHLDLTLREPGLEAVDLVIWPETAVTYFLDRDEDLRRLIAKAIPPKGYLVTGALRGEPATGDVEKYWNSVYALDRSGYTLATADKFHLVPLGEYVPLQKWLPFIKKLTAGAGSFSAAEGPRSLHLDDIPPFGVLICYEVIFPGAVVDRADRPQWLLNVTNDGWFGRSTGPYQHFASARFRAVEEGLPVVRAANSGVSAVIDSWGRVRTESDLNVDAVIDVKLPTAQPPTIFAKWHLTGSVVLLFTCLVLGFGFATHRGLRTPS